MLQSFLKSFKHSSQDVQIWECVPLVVVAEGENVLFAKETKIEFTPFEKSSNLIGSAIGIPDGSEDSTEAEQPQITINLCQYLDNPIEMGRRQGIILNGVDQLGNGVTWYINGAADRYLASPDPEAVDFDEETEAILKAELGESGPGKTFINQYL